MAKLNDQWFAAAQGTDDGPIIPIGYDDSPPNARIGIYPPRLLCPACGDDHIHTTAVECFAAGWDQSRVVIANGGLSVKPTEGTYSLRDAMITLQFRCEQGHEFLYTLQFHEGNTFIERQVWKSPDIDAVQTIWRD